MSGMSDYAFSTKMRDTIVRLAEEVVQRLRPADRYGIVSSIDLVNRKAGVTLNGETTPVTVNLGALIPLAVGQKVRVSGTTGDKFIADIFGGAYFDEVGATRLRAQGSDLSLASTGHGFQVGLDTGANVAIDQNEIMARNNGAVANLWLNADGGPVKIGGNLDLDDPTNEIQIGRDASYQTRLNYNQLRALTNGVASTLYFQYGGGDVSIAGGSATGGILSPGTMRIKSHLNSTNEANYSGTAATLGSSVCGFSFVAPPSGQGALDVQCFVDVTTTNELGRIFGQVRTGGTIGAGTIVHEGNSDNGPLIIVEAHNGTGNFMGGSGLTLVTGLTPGATYNASVWYACSSTACILGVNQRRITWIPSM